MLIIPRTPFPVTVEKSEGLIKLIFRSFAAETIALANGCSLLFSKLAAKDKISFSLKFGAAIIFCKTGFPSVNVPVLSITRTFIFSNCSRASAFLIRIPSCAARPMPTIIDIGVAKPSAQGQATINTVIAEIKL